MQTGNIQIENSAWPQLTDTEIAGMVLNALKWQSMISEDKIMITVKDGIVTLDGEADSEFQRNDAKAVIQRLQGVRRVINLINLKPIPHSPI